MENNSKNSEKKYDFSKNGSLGTESLKTRTQILNNFSQVLYSKISAIFKLIVLFFPHKIERMVTLLSRISANIISSMFDRWKNQNPRKKNILSGLKILENQKKKRDKQKKVRKNRKEEVQIERAFTVILRTINRMKKKLLFESFVCLLKNHLKSEKILFYLKIKKLRKMRNIFKHIKELRKLNLQISEKLFKIFKGLKLGRLKLYYKEIIKIKIKIQQEKLNFYLKIKQKRLLRKLIKKWKNLRKNSKILQYYQNSDDKNHYTVRQKATKFLIEKWTKTQKKLYLKGFVTLKINSITKHHSLVFEKLFRIIVNKNRLSKKTGLLCLKYFIDTKKHNAVLWRLKFYQLEGLIQHKQEEIHLKLKNWYFENWKSRVEKINQIKRKFMLKRASKLYSVLHVTVEKYRKLLLFHSFFSFYNLMISQNLSVKKLEKVYKKQKIFAFFEKWRRKLIFKAISPRIYRKSYIPLSMHEISPKVAMTNRENYKIPQKFGFYAEKRLSMDNVHRYIDQMIKVIPPSQKCISPNVFGTTPSISIRSENHSRNTSNITNK